MSNPKAEEAEADSYAAVYAKAYRKLGEKAAGTIRFFDRSGDGENFIVYETDAKLTATHLFKTNTAIKSCKDGDKTLEYAYIKRGEFEEFVRELLLIRQFRVEVFVNESKSKMRVEWVPKYKASPGNLAQFEDILFSSNSEINVNVGVMGIKVGYVDRTKTVGVAHINMNECQIHLIEFADNDSLTNLESVLIQLSPKEAVFPTTNSSNEDVVTLRKILERNRIVSNELKGADFDTKNVDQDMPKLLQKENGKLQNPTAFPDFEKKLAVSGLAGAVKYLELLSGESYLNQFTLKPFDFGLYAKLDSSACRALHLSLNYLEKRSRNDISLLGTIDKCRTSQGHRLIAQYLKQPLLSKEKLEERLDMVEILMNDVILRQSLHEEHLRRVPDCQIIARKLLKKKVNLQDCYKAYLFLSKMQKMMDDLNSHESDKKHVLKTLFIDPINSMNDDLNRFKELVESTLDLDRAEKGEFMVRSDFDDVFKKIKSEMDKIESEMGDLLYREARKLGLEANKTIKLESNSNIGHFFRITLKDEKAIRGNKSFEIMQSKKSGVSFRNSELEHFSNKYDAARAKYETEQKTIVEEVSTIAADYHSCFVELGRLIAELDVFTSFAYVSANSPLPFVRPKLLAKGSGILRYKDLRHPCIESLPSVNFIPNDVHFERDKQTFYIITGPNMGGKSTLLRSIGIATLLAHVGCFVPATEATVSMVDAILARVGASDCLVKGVSTFMAEMIETAHILKTSTADSLVIIDELGRGTSTYDGFGLCWAISKHLAKNVGCYCVLATHFHELTDLADEVPTVINYHVTAVPGDEGLTMLYKIEKGPCDRSFGIHVASYVGFPEDVLNDAKAMSKLLEDFCQEEDTDDSEAAVKRRRDDKAAGQLLIDEFMGKIREFVKGQNVACENGSLRTDEADKMLQAKVQELLVEINKKGGKNPYLQHLLRQAEEMENLCENQPEKMEGVVEGNEMS